MDKFTEADLDNARHTIEVIDDEICDDVIVIDVAEDGHPTDVTIPPSAFGKPIPIQSYMEQMRSDYAPLARALAKR
jgi:hypothetical protein